MPITTREDFMRIHAKLAMAAAAALFLISAPVLAPAQAFSPILDVGSDVVHVAAILQFAEMAAALGQSAPTPMDAFEVFDVNATATWR